jgi:flagellin
VLESSLNLISARQLNWLESTLANLQTGVEPTSASRSRAQDADFAIETANLVRTQILLQAAISMTSQANAMPKMALSLLRS